MSGRVRRPFCLFSPVVCLCALLAGAASSQPATPASGKVIYGTDNRLDVYAETDPSRSELADSVCALVSATDLVQGAEGAFTLQASDFRVFGQPPCEGEPFGNQPVAAFCTGFMVGPDLIATAGHCMSEPELAGARFVFGFQMLDANTPRLSFDASEVYTGIEVVARQLEGDFDYAVVRVDRDIVAPGARTLRLRTAGEISPGTRVGVVGHPSGLPAKIAFGAETVVRASDNPGFFVANLDTYGGNSGSPVFNADTHVVEGILVRGEADFESEIDCFRSRVLAATGGTGEDVSKATTFSENVQSGRGTVSLDKPAYQCSDTIAVTLYDDDLEGVETVDVRVFTSGEDTETLTLTPTGRFSTFAAAIDVSGGKPVTGNGVVEAMEGATIFVAYADEDTGAGAPGDAVATARVDCTPPVITDVRVAHASGTRVRIAFSTDEPASGLVEVGLACDNLTLVGEGGATTAHEVEVANLELLTDYAFRVSATDPAGNTATDDNGGVCFSVTTTDMPDFLTETFFNETSDLANLSVTFMPGGPSGYTACVAPVDGFPVTPFCGEIVALNDDDFVRHSLTGGRTVPFFGETYDAIFVGSNGYVTFGAGDVEYEPTLAHHFAVPRISGSFSDLFPPSGGEISVAELEDRVAVTYLNVPNISGDIQSFQIEMFYDGTIRLTWIALTRPFAISGLSPGRGLDPGFEASDLSGYLACMDSPYGDFECDANVPFDDCGDAGVAEIGPLYQGSTTLAQGSSGISGCESCFGPDVWYVFTPPETGVYTLSLCDSQFDTFLGVYAGDCGGLTPVGSNDDGSCGLQSELAIQLTEGTTYRIRISGYQATAGVYQFEITEGGKVVAGCRAGGSRSSGYGDIALVAGLLAALLWYARRKPEGRTRWASKCAGAVPR